MKLLGGAMQRPKGAQAKIQATRRDYEHECSRSLN
jgi:hypothetical protein